VLLGAFVLPGFITLLLTERTYSIRREESPFERLLRALYYSFLVYGSAGAGGLVVGTEKADVTRIWEGDAALEAYLGLALLGLLILPLAVAETSRRWSRSRRVRPWALKKLDIDLGHSVPSAWEQLFGGSRGALERRGLLLRVTLKDGRIVGGFFGDASLAGYTEDRRDLFIEERWSLNHNDWFEAPVPASRGVWLSDEQIQSVEAYVPPEATS
jgi:hypothetical protein